MRLGSPHHFKYDIYFCESTRLQSVSWNTRGQCEHNVEQRLAIKRPDLFTDPVWHFPHPTFHLALDHFKDVNQLLRSFPRVRRFLSLTRFSTWSVWAEGEKAIPDFYWARGLFFPPPTYHELRQTNYGALLDVFAGSRSSLSRPEPGRWRSNRSHRLAVLSGNIREDQSSLGMLKDIPYNVNGAYSYV